VGSTTSAHCWSPRCSAGIAAAAATITRLDEHIDAELAPFSLRSQPCWTPSPASAPTAAQVIVAETGADLSRFPTAAHPAS
jgi:hypothetical protein